MACSSEAMRMQRGPCHWTTLAITRFTGRMGVTVPQLPKHSHGVQEPFNPTPLSYIDPSEHGASDRLSVHTACTRLKLYNLITQE